MVEKTLNYIKTLSNVEIEEQLNDFLLWAREYEQALKKELKERQENVASIPPNSDSQIVITNIKDTVPQENSCPECGNKLDNGSIFCGKCGNRVC